MEVAQKASYPTVELNAESTSCSAALLDLFRSSVPVDPAVGYNVGSGDSAMSDAWGLPNGLGGMTMVNAGTQTSSTDFFSVEAPAPPEEDLNSALGFEKDAEPTDGMFAMAPYGDGLPPSVRPVSTDGWGPPDEAADPDSYVADIWPAEA